jgi:hypothetical protein
LSGFNKTRKNAGPMNRLIILYLGIFLINCISATSTAQTPYQTLSAYDEILLVDFIEELEQKTELNFFYDAPRLDSFLLRNIMVGSSLGKVLSEGFTDTILNYYSEGNDVYFFAGSPLVSELPDYKNQNVISKKRDVQKKELLETKYIKATDNSRRNVITIGKKQKHINGRKCRISGNIINRSSGESLIGATIYIKKLELGAISDVNGNFEMELPAGIYTASINHMAMKEEEYGLKVLSDGTSSIELENNLFELEEITVIDKRRSNVEGMQMGFERISTKSMKEIPVVLGEKDILKVAQMLPGVQNVGEGSSGFNVRGGSADQNMFYINNISVYNTSHLFGFFTAFSPDVISDFSLYKTNIPAKYGGRIASVFEINTREGNKNNFYTQGGISPITGHISMEGPIVKEKVTFVTSIRSTYSDWLLKRIKDNDISNSNASFYDGTFGINADLNENNQLKAFYYHSSDEFSLSSRNDYSYTNSGASLKWRHKYSSSFSSDFSVASSLYQFENIDKNNISEAYKQNYGLKHSEARMDFLFLAGEKHRIEFGINSVFYDLNRGTITPFGEESKRIPIHLSPEKGVENSAYLSDEFNLFPKLNLLLGLRYSNFSYLGPSDVTLYEEGLPKNKYTINGSSHFEAGEAVKTYSGIEPRIALNYRIARNSSIKASYNHLQQYIFLLSNTIALSPTDQWKLTDYHTQPPEADQYSLGFYYDFANDGVNLSFEVYKKSIQNIVEYKDGVNFISGETIEIQTLQGLQDSKGIELMIKKNNYKLTGWISYTYSRSIVTVDGIYDEMQINGGEPYPSNYDRPHSFNLVANYRISRRVSLSSNIVYTSGRPVTLPVAIYYSDSRPYLYYSDRNKYRIPDYFRIDFSLNLEGNLKYKKLAHSYWMLNIYNLTGRDNAYSIFYEARRGNIKGYKMSVFAQPIITLSWNFKFGNYNSE